MFVLKFEYKVYNNYMNNFNDKVFKLYLFFNILVIIIFFCLLLFLGLYIVLYMFVNLLFVIRDLMLIVDEGRIYLLVLLIVMLLYM